MTPEQLARCREWFEREGLSNSFGHFSDAKRPNGDYHSSHSQVMWLTAQAAWSAAQAQGVDAGIEQAIVSVLFGAMPAGDGKSTVPNSRIKRLAEALSSANARKRSTPTTQQPAQTAPGAPTVKPL